MERTKHPVDGNGSSAAGSPAPASDADRARLRSILEAAQSGDVGRAAEMAEAALADGLRHPLLYNVSALKLESDGRLEESAALLRRALQANPGDVSLMHALGLCLNRLEQWQDALPLFDAVIAADPGFAPAHCARGISCEALLSLRDAEASYSRTLELQPGNLAALSGMASLCNLRGDHEDARRFAQQVLESAPAHPDAVQVIAAADIAAGAPAEAEKSLRRLLTEPHLAPLEQARTSGLLADALDALDRTDEAFAAYTACNEERRRIYASRFAAGPGALDVVRWTATGVEKAGRRTRVRTVLDPTEWGGARRHVFLLGFARSGTTLLEQLLASHPDVETLDERENLIDAVRSFMRTPSDFERFLGADDDELRAYRQRYWQRVREAGAEVAGRVFVDKHPLNTLKLPLITALFPDAKILFARRDPRDVVLSCFRRRFRLSAPMYEMLTLEGAAALYAGTMHLARCVDAVSRMDQRVVRHERLVADFEPEVKAICAFIGLQWADGMRDFAARLRDNASATPSAAQLARGLNADGVGQWRRYEAHLKPVLPVLAPWVERFGYPLA